MSAAIATTLGRRTSTPKYHYFAQSGDFVTVRAHFESMPDSPHDPA